jgi:hypothetical protein
MESKIKQKEGVPLRKRRGEGIARSTHEHDSTALYLISSGHGDLSDALT